MPAFAPEPPDGGCIGLVAGIRLFSELAGAACTGGVLDALGASDPLDDGGVEPITGLEFAVFAGVPGSTDEAGAVPIVGFELVAASAGVYRLGGVLDALAPVLGLLAPIDMFALCGAVPTGTGPVPLEDAFDTDPLPPPPMLFKRSPIAWGAFAAPAATDVPLDVTAAPAAAPAAAADATSATPRLEPPPAKFAAMASDL